MTDQTPEGHVETESAEVNPNDYNKSDLQTAAEVVGVDETGTKKEIAGRLSSRAPRLVAYVIPGGGPGVGAWVDVKDGEHAGRFGYIESVSTVADDGTPESVFVRTRDADNLQLEVPYEHVKQSRRGGGR